MDNEETRLREELAERKWTVFCPSKGTHSVGPAGGLGWTRDKDEAAETAAMLGGVVVDADDFSAHWPMYIQIAALSGEMPPDVIAKMEVPSDWLATEGA